MPFVQLLSLIQTWHQILGAMLTFLLIYTRDDGVDRMNLARIIQPRTTLKQLLGVWRQTIVNRRRHNNFNAN